MGIASKEVQEKRAVVLRSFVLALLFCLPFINMLTGAIFLLMWGGMILGTSSNVLKDLLILLAAIAAIAISSYGSLYINSSSKSDLITGVVVTFIVAWIALYLVQKNVEAVND